MIITQLFTLEKKSAEFKTADINLCVVDKIFEISLTN